MACHCPQCRRTLHWTALRTRHTVCETCGVEVEISFVGIVALPIICALIEWLFLELTSDWHWWWRFSTSFTLWLGAVMLLADPLLRPRVKRPPMSITRWQRR